MRTLPRSITKQEEIDENTLIPETLINFIFGAQRGICWIRVKVTAGKNS